MECHEENPFKIRAFRGAREALKALSDDELEKKIKSKELMKIRGIGKGVFAVAEQFLNTQTSEEWNSAKAELPSSILELAPLKGLGPKKIYKLNQELGIENLSELEYACNENRLISLEGFGPKTQEKVLQEIETLKSHQGKMLLSDAQAKAEKLEKKFEKNSLFARVGDLGRASQTISQLEYLFVESKKAVKPKWVQSLLKSSQSETQKENQIEFKTADGFSIKFQFCKEAEFFAKSVQLTSSEEHWKFLEKNSEKKNKQNLSEQSFKSEAEVYESLGLVFCPPEARELPPPSKQNWLWISPQDIKGVFHAHTTYSDGKNELSEMLKACEERGWQYFGISEHSQTAFYAQGLKEERLLQQWKEIDELNSQSSCRILKGIESDILKDGSLDYSKKLLQKFDFVIASIHQRYGMKEMTDRLLTAIKNPYTTMIGHLSGRLLLGRDPYAYDLERIIREAISQNVVVEFNCNPHRLDMDWRELKKATDAGLLTSLNPDAHSIEGLDDLQYGLLMARKAQISPKQIINTWSLDELQDWLENRKKKAA